MQGSITIKTYRNNGNSKHREKDLRGDEGTVRQLLAAREGTLRPLPPARKDELDGRGGRVRETGHQQADVADLP